MKFKDAAEESNHFYVRMITNSLKQNRTFILKQVIDLDNSRTNQGTKSLASSFRGGTIF